MSEVDFDGYLTGQFAEEPVAEETAPVETVAETTEPEPVAPVEETPAEPELILGKYRTADDLAEAYRNLEREKGRLAQEVGELRQAVQPVQPVQSAPVDPGTVEDAFVNNPAAARNAAVQAATRALEQGDTAGYESIIETWGQYDQFGALRFDTARQTAAAQQQIVAQIAPQVQTARQYVEQNANQAATLAVQARHPDFEQVVGDLADASQVQNIIDAGFPVEMLQLANGTQQQKEQLLETLYRWRVAEQAGQAAQAAPAVAAAAAQEHRDAKKAAVVASASSAPAAEATSEDPELDAFYAYLTSPTPTSWADLRPTGQ